MSEPQSAGSRDAAGMSRRRARSSASAARALDRLPGNVSVLFRPAGLRRPSLLALAALTVGSWLALLGGGLAGDSAGMFLLGWLVMMIAMMLPAAAPMIMVVRLAAPAGRWAEAQTAVFVAGYLMVWIGLGIVAMAVQSALRASDPPVQVWAAVAVLTLAGAYQFSPLKDACLRACRSPMDFLVLHWRSGALGMLRLGIDHGLYCIGCCWALMAVLVVAGGMGIASVATIALVVFVEKVLPGATAVSRIVGLALLAAAALVAVWPGLYPIAANSM